MNFEQQEKSENWKFDHFSSTFDRHDMTWLSWSRNMKQKIDIFSINVNANWNATKKKESEHKSALQEIQSDHRQSTTDEIKGNLRVHSLTTNRCKKKKTCRICMYQCAWLRVSVMNFRLSFWQVQLNNRSHFDANAFSISFFVQQYGMLTKNSILNKRKIGTQQSKIEKKNSVIVTI